MVHHMYNSLLYGLPDSLFQKLQRMQNAAARMLTRTPKYDHVTPILKQLHWLPVSQRVTYKVLMIVFKVIHGLAPAYLEEMLELKPTSGRSMRSNNQSLLLAPKARSATYGDRNFRVLGPALWNKLPLSL